tara:strand:- start:18499 stop:18855 length:357 start_codon:yes stop_codon:yes gene_type:complete
MSWFDTLKMHCGTEREKSDEMDKAPPIRNPRESEFSDNANDDKSMLFYQGLFREVADPVIREAAEKKRKFANVKLSDLKMSSERAKEVAKELYAGMGYNMIFASETDLIFKIVGEGRV